jgi:hypothetical protein
MRDLPHVKLFPSDLIDDMHEAFEAVCATLRLTPQSDKATALVITKIVELAKAGRRGTDLATETLRFLPAALSFDLAFVTRLALGSLSRQADITRSDGDQDAHSRDDHPVRLN